jgi:hypothetical protein
MAWQAELLLDLRVMSPPMATRPGRRRDDPDPLDGGIRPELLERCGGHRHEDRRPVLAR